MQKTIRSPVLSEEPLPRGTVPHFIKLKMRIITIRQGLLERMMTACENTSSKEFFCL